MKKTVIFTKNAPDPVGPYSQAILVDNQLFVSGQIAINPANGEFVTDEIGKETKQVMNNLKAVLEEAGMTFSDVIKCSIFLQSMDQFAQVNDVYATYFGENPPVRETVEVSKLPKGVNVEISLIAIK